MRVKNEQEIEQLADRHSMSLENKFTQSALVNMPFTIALESYRQGYTQAQQDFISQASEGFKTWFDLAWCDMSFDENGNANGIGNTFDANHNCNKAWVACSLHHAKKMQEKDAQISELQKEIDELKNQRDIALNDLSIEAREVDELKSENEELKKTASAWEQMYKDLNSRIIR